MNYYVNDKAQSNGDHEVHVPTCIYFNKIDSKTDLGRHTNCKSAVAAAKRIYSKSNGCYYCARECHTS